MGKRLLVCGSGDGMEHSLEIVRDLASEIIMITDRPASAQPYVDVVLTVYPRDEATVLDAVKQADIARPDGVLSLGYENPPVISRLAEYFGCPHLPYETARRATHKDRRIATLRKAGIPVADFIVAKDENEALNAVQQFGYPCVVKPNDKTSSIGVSIIQSFEQASDLICEAASHSETSTVLVEKLLEGSEHSIEGIISNGVIYVTGFGDRNYAEKHRFSPFVFENGDNLPSKLALHEQRAMRRVTETGIRALDLDNTVFKGDLLLGTDGKTYILELTPRLSGARWGTELVPLSTGVHILRNAVRLAFGDPIDTSEMVPSIVPPCHVAARFLPSCGGTVRHIGDIAELKKQSGVYDASWEREITSGMYLRPYQSGKDMIASVITTGNSAQEAASLAEAAIKAVPIVIEPERNLNKVRPTQSFGGSLEQARP